MATEGITSTKRGQCLRCRDERTYWSELNGDGLCLHCSLERSRLERKGIDVTSAEYREARHRELDDAQERLQKVHGIEGLTPAMVEEAHARIDRIGEYEARAKALLTPAKRRYDVRDHPLGKVVVVVENAAITYARLWQDDEHRDLWDSPDICWEAGRGDAVAWFELREREL